MDYPFTKEELTAMIDKLWKDNKDKIDYQAISDLYKHNDWQWGGHNEPYYVPEYRDIKYFIKERFKDCKELFIKQYFEDNLRLDYDGGKVSISCGRMLCEMEWDEYDDEHCISFSVDLRDDLVLLDATGCSNYMDESDNYDD